MQKGPYPLTRTDLQLVMLVGLYNRDGLQADGSWENGMHLVWGATFPDAPTVAHALLRQLDLVAWMPILHSSAPPGWGLTELSSDIRRH